VSSLRRRPEQNSHCALVYAQAQHEKDGDDAARSAVRFALIALLIVGSCGGGGNPDTSTTSAPASSVQTQQAGQATEPGNSTQATLYWDPVTKPPVDGYRVHYGTQSRVYTGHIDTGNVTSWTIQNLQPGTYYFAVTAIKAGHGRSAYSNEVSKTIKGGDGD
jgi:hypothetical protein